MVKDLKDGLELYEEVARGFMMKSIKNVVINVIEDLTM